MTKTPLTAMVRRSGSIVLAALLAGCPQASSPPKAASTGASSAVTSGTTTTAAAATGSGAGTSSGSGTSTSGQPIFPDSGVPPNPVLQPLPYALPDGSVFVPPPPNACDSPYDHFYGKEPGVYAYWALCESGTSPALFDYVGLWDLNSAAGAWSTDAGFIQGGSPGPVPDTETAASVGTATAFLENQDIPLSMAGGTMATWINADATSTPVTALFFAAVGGSSGVQVAVSADPTTAGDVCFAGQFQNAAGTPYTVTQCGYPANAWHRVVLTWGGSQIALYVDSTSGAPVGTLGTTGLLDDTVFYYKLFPGCCDTGKQMTLAKALIANQAWTSTQVAVDAKPTLIAPPTGGVYVTSQLLGAIHRDVLGYGDVSDLSDAGVVSAMLAGLGKAGVTSVRFAGGYGGITADLENWQGGPACTTDAGITTPSVTLTTEDTLDNFMARVAQPLGLSVGYTVNYGTNASACDAGGDPIVNGADLVSYANTQKRYGLKYFEIGNEQYSLSSETDFHPNPNQGSSYATYEPAFYTAMKAQDSSIQIGVPYGGTTVIEWATGFTNPVLAGASYDAVVFHNYPMKDPISDGDTLYQDRVASNLTRTRGGLLSTQTELLSHGKPTDAIWVTEWDGDVAGDMWSRQTMGAVMPLFATVQLAEYMRVGVPYATWWAQGATNSCYNYYFDASAVQAYSWWNCGGAFLAYTGPLQGEIPIGLKAGDITPAARAIQILSMSGFVTEGEHMLETVTDTQTSPWLLSYAATHGGSAAVILINRDRDLPHTVPVQLAGQASGTGVLQYTYGRAQYDQSYFGNWEIDPFQYVQPAWSNTFQAELAPWSVNVLVFGD